MTEEQRTTVLGSLGIIGAVVAVVSMTQCSADHNESMDRRYAVQRQAESLERIALYESLSKASEASPERKQLMEIIESQIDEFGAE